MKSITFNIIFAIASNDITMDTLPQAMLFLGIIPALLLIYISLKGYEGLFKEKTIFITFIAGIIAGVVSIIIESATVKVGIYAIILFPVLEQLFKTMILNLRRFQGKKETVIYGLTLGVGFGSVFTPYYIIITSMSSNNINTVYLGFIASIGIILLHGATGILLGYGVYQSELVKYFFITLILYIPTPILSSFGGYIPILLVPYGLVIYWYITTRIMPNIKLKSRKRVEKTE